MQLCEGYGVELCEGYGVELCEGHAVKLVTSKTPHFYWYFLCQSFFICYPLPITSI